ncbi:MAG: hypothetical protein SFY32_00975 [Bacteroidota bacterium]|nr:hypothetical protein [Bacteroidota bacterium]
MSKPYAIFDYSQLPIVVIDVQREPLSVEDFQVYLTEMEEMYKKHESVILIFDTEKAKYLSGEFRILQGNWIKAHKHTIAKQAQHMIFIISSPIINMILKAILIIQPLPAPHKVVKSKEEAIEFAHQLLVAL